jgi:hypothetical protein
MDSNLLGGTVDDVLGAVFDAAPAEVLVVNPSVRTVEGLVWTADGATDPPNVRALAAPDVLKELADDFTVASAAADLVAAGTLSLRTAGDLPGNAVLLTDERVVALVDAGDQVGGIVTGDNSFHDAAGEAYEAEWERASPFELRTPARSAVESSLAAALGEGVEDDFDAMLTSAGTARGDGSGLDEVTLSLLAAAKHRELLYDISKWGEDSGVASKATFSRTKTELEDAGLIETEKVPIDVGRPRLRLTLADERLRDADASELASVASSVLASA